MFEDVEEMREDGEQPLHFYYNRENRIAHAPQNVKDFYAGKMKTPRGLKVLFNKQNKFILFGLLLVVGFGWGYSGLNKTKAYTTIDDINFELSAFAYDDVVFTSVKLKRKSQSNDETPKLVNAEIRVIDPNKQVSDKQILSCVYKEGEQYLRAKFSDYDIIKVDVVLNINDQEKTITSEVKR